MKAIKSAQRILLALSDKLQVKMFKKNVYIADSLIAASMRLYHVALPAVVLIYNSTDISYDVSNGNYLHSVGIHVFLDSNQMRMFNPASGKTEDPCDEAAWEAAAVKNGYSGLDYMQVILDVIAPNGVTRQERLIDNVHLSRITQVTAGETVELISLTENSTRVAGHQGINVQYYEIEQGRLN